MKARVDHHPRDRRWPPKRLLVASGIGGFLLGGLFVVVLLLLFGPQPAPIQTQRVPHGADISVTMNDAFLSQQIAAGIAAAHLPIALTDVRAHILPDDQMQLSANALGLGLLPNHLAATGRLYVANGKLLVHITRASVGGLPMPGAVTAALEDAINTQLAVEETNMIPPSTTRYAVSSVTTRNGSMTINFNPA